MDDYRTLDFQRREYKRRRFLAMPLAGGIVWFFIGLFSAVLTDEYASLVLFIGTGCIAYVGIYISRYTGEDFMDKTRPKNVFDQLFMYSIGMALLVYAIALPFFLVDKSSLPLTVGILTGLMWIPHAWIIEHWIGIFHAVTRTLCILIGWYFFPDLRFTLVPMIIVLTYLVTILVLETRWREMSF
ncbi:DUF7010 family protein [Neptunicella sp. SCSIO 80796]|uniref:DUF7010 family protein n=1 Tax=Neptunicella plasticusilytica TaxID=3117012 RepID=UPI003A4DC694